MAGEEHSYTDDEAMALAWAMYQLGAEHERMYHQTSERNIIDDYTEGYLAAIRGARHEQQQRSSGDGE